MADFLPVTETIGTDGIRDFALMASYIASLPALFANETREGIVFADGDFDETNINISTPNALDPGKLLVHAEIGELPVFKPASGAGGQIFTLGDRGQISVVGLTADATNLTGNANGFIIDSDAGISTVGCVAKNMPGTGVGYFRAGSQNLLSVFCLALNCGGDGYGGLGGNVAPIVGCGAVGCAIGFKGRDVTKRLNLTACYALDNTTDVDDTTVDLRRFLYISDASIADADDVFINQDPADLGFVNFAGEDFRLKADSLLIGKGFPIWNKLQVANPVIPLQDAFGRATGFDYGTRMNIGPFQPTFKVLKTGGRLIVLGIL